jgi:Matrixin
VDFDNPGTGGEAQVNNLKVPSNTLIVYVGGRADLGGSELGHGGPGGWGASGTSSWLNTVRTRGQSGAGASTPTDFAPWGGAITFKSNVNWNFNATSPTSSQNDFLSVATHELGHVFGIGTADSWQNKISGGFFTGSNSRTANGGANPAVDPGQGHWKQGIKSTVNGKSQEVVMDPALTVGTRRFFTRLDYAGLSDIGWQVPGTAVVTTAASSASVASAVPTVQAAGLPFAAHKVIDDLTV